MGIKILSVNASKPMSYLLQTILSNQYDLISVTHVLEAMDKLKKKKGIALIVIDVDFHTQENKDFLLHIKASKLYQSPIIILTSDQAMAESLRADVNKVILKPFNPTDLVTFIKETIPDYKRYDPAA